MTPRRRQGAGRAAIDHIAAGLTDALSELSRVTVGQAAMAEAARGDRDRLYTLLDRLDDGSLAAVRDCAELVACLAKDEQVRRGPEGKSP